MGDWKKQNKKLKETIKIKNIIKKKKKIDEYEIFKRIQITYKSDQINLIDKKLKNCSFSLHQD
jgi:hypothetical protein